MYTYSVHSLNICPKSDCQNNPTFFVEGEEGPYKKYKFANKPPNTVIVNEVEPLGINPNGRENLKKLYSELKEKFWQDAASWPFYGDGLPAITHERMKSESVVCTTHDVNIQLVDSKLLAVHCQSECVLGN